MGSEFEKSRYRAYVYGLPRSGNCLLWRTCKYLVGEPASLAQFKAFEFGSIHRSHFVNGKPKFLAGPKERSIGIIRDPRDVLVSISQWDTKNECVGVANNWTLDNPETKVEWCRRWKEAHDWIKKNCTLRIRYEDLMRDYKTEVELLCVMLGVVYVDMQDLLMYAQKSNGHGSGGGVGAWKRVLDGKTAAYVVDTLGGEMAKLGYEVCHPLPR